MAKVVLAAVAVAASLLFVSGCVAVGGVRDAGPPLRAQAALGVQRVLVLAVSFPDEPTVPALGRIKERMLDRVTAYYATASWGKTRLRGDVRGWYRLPRPLVEYQVSPYNIQVDRTRVRRLVADAFNAAEKEVAFDRYDHVIVVVGVTTRPGVGYGMIAYSANPGMLTTGVFRYGGARMETVVTSAGQRFSGGIIVVAQNAHPGHVVHDLAHALGGVVAGRRPIPDLYDTVLQGKVGPLTHESFPRFTGFMGPWDVMSRHFTTWEQPPPGMSSFTRLRMGWIGSDQVVDVPPGASRPVTLSPLADGKGTLAIRIPGRWATHYLLENRQPLPGDPVPPATGLVILHVDESQEDGDGIVRVVDADPGVPDFGAAAFGVGSGQTPSARLPIDVAVEVLWQQGADLTVMVTTPSRGPEVQAVATRIREKDRELRQLPESPVHAPARADLAAAMDLLVQMKLAEARAAVDAITQRARGNE
ncbi:MAG: hypothetical protein A3E31_17810 [Candidatus Rokubacteria bacterium RIFCSPHIGHO2_12_FULL_73_22]|nr:MAG: hypothetical protein A3E31_17810 [Candidatus Rokubacteria bacterium RIFCSPHIGHO2_12_FULL_73_22]